MTQTAPPTAPDLRGLAEAAKYDQLVDRHRMNWWDQQGLLGGLHLINAARVPYFDRALGGYAGKRVLDVGCGGGLFSESMARAGASVVAFDPSEKSLAAAREHARESKLDIDYRFAYAEEFDAKERFDAVFAVDVLEHVNDLNATLDMAKRHLKPGGLFGFLTHNQTLEAFTFLVWEGEYHTGFIPKGNHDFHKFITPEDLTERLAARGLNIADIKGVHFDLGAQPPRVVESDDTTISYMGYAR